MKVKSKKDGLDNWSEQAMFIDLESFVVLVEQNPELFNAEDLHDLKQNVPHWSDDKDDLEDEIFEWLKTRPRIKKEIDKLSVIASESNKKRYPGSYEDCPKEIPLNPENWKSNVINAVHDCLETNYDKKTKEKNISSTKTMGKQESGLL